MGTLECLSFIRGWKEQFQDITGFTQGHTADGLQPGPQVPEQCYAISPRVREHSRSVTPSRPQPPKFLSRLPKELASLLTMGCEEKGKMTMLIPARMESELHHGQHLDQPRDPEASAH